ncbi:methyltransferase domain-containing protein [Phytohabitans rumicis]|uniref:methyltransferase domain-containing protein n=1 Tax=Phytohabitans rumicis TaxID=1076125 RepID=UPI0031EC7B63
MLDAAETMPAAALLRARSYQLLRLPPDATVLDVGCGTGRAVAELAEHGARAIGVDLDPTMLAAARSRFPGIDVRAAAATELPLGDGQAHGYRADKVYHVLPDPVVGESGSAQEAGLTNREIAGKMFLAEKTVKNYVPRRRCWPPATR